MVISLTNTQSYILDNFIELGSLDDNGKIMLIQDKSTKRLYVKKCVKPELITIYQHIKNSGLACFSDILYLISEKNKLTVIEEYFSGYSLKQFIANKGVLKKEKADAILARLCDAVGYLHKKGIIHRDLSVENILISGDGCVKIVDFDISRFSDGTKCQDTTILGTVGFAAPEQFGFKETDKSADIYSLGAIYNYMLTGKLPNEVLPTNRRSRAIVEKCCDMAPDRRYKCTKALKDSLSGIDARKTDILVHTLGIFFVILLLLSIIDACGAFGVGFLLLSIILLLRSFTALILKKPARLYALGAFAALVISLILILNSTTGQNSQPQSMAFPTTEIINLV